MNSAAVTAAAPEATPETWMYGLTISRLPSAFTVKPTFRLSVSSADATFNCATFTASVSCKPAATFVICRVPPAVPPPTDTAASVLFHVAPSEPVPEYEPPVITS